MAKGFSLSIAADTRAFTTAVKRGITEPLDDAAEILEDIGREGGRDLESVERAARESQGQTERLKDEYRKLQQEIRETGRKARTDFANPVKAATGEVSDNVKETMNETRQNLAETLSSFDGSVESLVDGVQGTLGGLTAGLGGILPVAATVAGAAGLGLITAEIAKQNEKAEELKQGLVDAYASAAAEGRAYLDEAQIIARSNEIIFDPERFKQVSEDAKTLGVDVSTAIRAQAGDLEALEVVSRTAADAERERLEIMDKDDGRAAGVLIELTELRKVADEYKNLQELNEENSELARIAGQVKADVEREAREEIARTRQAEEERWDAVAARFAENNGRQASIPVSLDTSEAERQLTNLTRRRTITVDVAGQGINGRFGTRVE